MARGAGGQVPWAIKPNATSSAGPLTSDPSDPVYHSIPDTPAPSSPKSVPWTCKLLSPAPVASSSDHDAFLVLQRTGPTDILPFP